jgi:alpha-1,3-glucosyltransferase
MRYSLLNSLAATILAFLPACIHVGYYPTRRGFIYALANTSLAFFLLSFQVHEKTILIPLLPITLLYTELPSLVVWFTNVATFR